MTLHNKQEAFASALVRESGVLSLPRKEMPHDGTGGQVAYDLLSNELLLDGSARLNLATFVTTWMPPYAARLMADTADKNMMTQRQAGRTACVLRPVGQHGVALGPDENTRAQVPLSFVDIECLRV